MSKHLPGVPNVPIGFRTRQNRKFDAEMEAYHGYLDGESDFDIVQRYKQKCGKMQKDMSKLLEKMENRYDIEREIDKLQNKLKKLDKEIEAMHSRLQEKY